MPLLKLETTASLTEEKRASVLSTLSRIIAEALGKPEEYVMVTLHQTSILMAGKPGDAAFADIRSIGALNDTVNRRLAENICQALNKSLGISPNRVYLNFTDVLAENWGWNSQTFG